MEFRDGGISQQWSFTMMELTLSIKHLNVLDHMLNIVTCFGATGNPFGQVIQESGAD